MKQISALTILLILCLFLPKLVAQTNRKVSGLVTDSAKNAISNAKVNLIVSQDTLKTGTKDTLTTQTDEYGTFSFSKINTGKFSIEISHVSYKISRAEYTFTEKERHKKLGEIILKPADRMLDEVVITGKPNPIRFMKDTVEYNAAAFRVTEGDNVADLIKQFPGMEVDAAYKVKTMGKEMVKLRVNGKDFFTSDIKDFIGKLPAGIVSKIQVIDDFGDQANFTGIKIGEPTKMLNIVTKPGMNNGGFGNVTGSAGTNDMIGSGGQLNFWDGDKQRSVNLNGTRSNNGAGKTSNFSAGFSNNDKINEHSRGGFRYNFDGNESAMSRESIIESITSKGSLINNSSMQGDNGSGGHNLTGSLNYNNKKIYMDASMALGYTRSNNTNKSLNKQSGLFLQDLDNKNTANSQVPRLNGYLNFSKKLKNPKNSLSGQANYSLSGNTSNQSIITNTLYYDEITGRLEKDSLLSREVDSKSTNNNMSFSLNYSHGFKKRSDSLADQSINFNYNGSGARSTTFVSTDVFDNQTGKVSYVDSLSTSFQSTTFNQAIGVNYNFDSRKRRFNIGVNAVPTMLNNRDIKLGQTIKYNRLNYSPTLNFSQTLSASKTVSMNYTGSNSSPSIYMLQPIMNTQSLQNIVVGNPKLKPSFNHNLNANFNYAHLKSGNSLQLGVNASAIQRNIVENITYIPDTLNSFKQITRYENVNGSYQINGDYTISIPFSTQKNSIRYSGGSGFSNNAVIFNNEKLFNKGFNFSQTVGVNLLIKKLQVNADLNYSLSTNSNATSMFGLYQVLGINQINAPIALTTQNFGANLNGNLNLKNFNMNGSMSYSSDHNDSSEDEAIRDVSNINMNLSGRVTLRKSYNINYNLNKRFNYGYALENTNPLVINIGLERTFLKNKSLAFGLNGNDLLGQGNNLARMVTGNTVIDTRTKQQTRVFSINLRYNLSKFGGRNFRVDQDLDIY